LNERNPFLKSLHSNYQGNTGEQVMGYDVPDDFDVSEIPGLSPRLVVPTSTYTTTATVLESKLAPSSSPSPLSTTLSSTSSLTTQPATPSLSLSTKPSPSLASTTTSMASSSSSNQFMSSFSSTTNYSQEDADEAGIVVCKVVYVEDDVEDDSKYGSAPRLPFTVNKHRTSVEVTKQCPPSILPPSTASLSTPSLTTASITISTTDTKDDSSTNTRGIDRKELERISSKHLRSHKRHRKDVNDSLQQAKNICIETNPNNVLFYVKKALAKIEVEKGKVFWTNKKPSFKKVFEKDWDEIHLLRIAAEQRVAK